MIAGSKEQGKKILTKLFRQFDNNTKLKAVSVDRKDFINLKKYFLSTGVNKHRRIVKLKSVTMTDKSFEFTMRNASGGSYRAVSVTQEGRPKVINDNTSGAAFDSDALAFFAVVNNLTTPQQQAISTFIKDRKTDGTWTKLKYFYPFAGGTAAFCKYNMVNPLDTDGAFRLTFSGGWTFNTAGALPNGTSDFADTHFHPLGPSDLANINDFTFGAYTNTNTTPVAHGALLGILTGGSDNILISPFAANNIFYRTGDLFNSFEAAANYIGSFMITRTSNISAKCWHNAVQQDVTVTSTRTSTTGAFTMYLAAENASGVAQKFSARNMQAAWGGSGFSDAQVLSFHNGLVTLIAAIH